MYSLSRYASIFILALLLAALDAIGGEGGKSVYLLAQPIAQTIELPKYVQGGLIGWDWLWGSAEVVAVYSLTGDPISSMGVAAYSATSGIPSVQAESRLLQEGVAAWRRRTELQKFAALPGAENIRVLSTGYSEFTGWYTSRLQSQSFVFLETGRALNSDDWILISDLENTKVRLSLSLPPPIIENNTIEVSLADLFEGKQLEPLQSKAWREDILAWSKTRPWWQRYLTNTGVQGLEINAVLINGADTIPLGPIAAGPAVESILQLKNSQRLLNTLRTAAGKAEKTPTMQTKNTEIIRGTGCVRWYENLLGRKIQIKE